MGNGNGPWSVTQNALPTAAGMTFANSSRLFNTLLRSISNDILGGQMGWQPAPGWNIYSIYIYMYMDHPRHPASLVNICCRSQDSGFGIRDSRLPHKNNSLCSLPKVNFRHKKKKKSVARGGRKVRRKGAICSPLTARLLWVVYKNFKRIPCALCWQRVRKICYLSFWLTVNGMGPTSLGRESYWEVGS